VCVCVCVCRPYTTNVDGSGSDRPTTVVAGVCSVDKTRYITARAHLFVREHRREHILSTTRALAGVCSVDKTRYFYMYIFMASMCTCTCIFLCICIFVRGFCSVCAREHIL